MIGMRAKRRIVNGRNSWASVAFLVEAMLLLVFLIASLAVFTKLFGAAMERAGESASLTQAVAIAQNTAELFAADPSAIEGESHEGGLRVVCDVEPEQRGAGTLYHATISVYDDALARADAVYTLQTSRYESESGVA